MTDQQLEKRLCDAVSHAAPNDLNGVLSRCEARKGTVIPMTKKMRPVFRNLIAACLVLVIAGVGGGLFYQNAYAVASVVSLDVNPSIELTVNQGEKILSCTPLNEEATEVLSDMGNGQDLKGTKLDVAVNAIVGALVRHGYLDSVSSAILISVEDSNQARAAQLQQELTQTVDSALQTESSQASVLSQTLTQNATLDQQAKAYNISTGKAALISQAIALNSSLDFEALCGLSVEELKDLAETGAPGMPIGTAEAARLAQSYAGVSTDTPYEVDPELDDAPAHYEVELYTQWGEFEYRIAAYSGEVLSGKANLGSSSTTSSSQGNTSSSGTSSGSSSTTSSGTSTTVTDRNKALEIALNHAGLKQSQISRLSIEQDRDDGVTIYEIEFRTDSAKYEYEITASGSVRKFEKEAFSSSATGDIGRDKAVSIALNHAGLSESQVTGLKVELDDNGREYEVDFKSGNMEYEYKIDAGSGNILQYEQDVDD